MLWGERPTTGPARAVTAAAPPLPDPPERHRRAWHAAVLEGIPVADVVAREVAPWLWAHWPARAEAGIDQAHVVSVAIASSRELWLWMAGERTWAQSGSALLGRLWRRTRTRPPPVAKRGKSRVSEDVPEGRDLRLGWPGGRDATCRRPVFLARYPRDAPIEVGRRRSSAADSPMT